MNSTDQFIVLIAGVLTAIMAAGMIFLGVTGQPITITCDAIVPDGNAAMTIGSIVFVEPPEKRGDGYEKTLIHESRHIEQYALTSLLAFPTIYGGNYLINYFVYQNSWDAYMNILYERDAYNYAEKWFEPELEVNF